MTHYPFALMENPDPEAGLLTQVKHELRRPPVGQPYVIHFGGFMVTVHHDGCALVLPPHVVSFPAAGPAPVPPHLRVPGEVVRG